MADFYSHSQALAAKHGARHIDRFFGLHCAADLLGWRVFPNTKEITETMAAVQAVFDHIPIERGAKATCVVVGDGKQPRTAATFACLTRWDCISIDPGMAQRPYSQIQRLRAIPLSIQNAPIYTESPTIVIQVHAHVRPTESLRYIFAPEIHMVSIPCCVPGGLPRKPDVAYVDDQIWSPKNTVQVWRYLRNPQATGGSPKKEYAGNSL